MTSKFKAHETCNYSKLGKHFNLKWAPLAVALVRKISEKKTKTINTHWLSHAKTNENRQLTFAETVPC